MTMTTDHSKKIQFSDLRKMTQFNSILIVISSNEFFSSRSLPFSIEFWCLRHLVNYGTNQHHGMNVFNSGFGLQLSMFFFLFRFWNLHTFFRVVDEQTAVYHLSGGLVPMVGLFVLLLLFSISTMQLTVDLMFSFGKFIRNYTKKNHSICNRIDWNRSRIQSNCSILYVIHSTYSKYIQIIRKSRKIVKNPSKPTENSPIHRKSIKTMKFPIECHAGKSQKTTTIPKSNEQWGKKRLKSFTFRMKSSQFKTLHKSSEEKTNPPSSDITIIILYSSW